MALFRNDFLKWHVAFIIPYTLTYIAGLFRGSSRLAYQLHPLFGMATVAVPLVVYLLLPNKKVIRQMIKSNFSMRCSPRMKIARISTQVIIIYFLFSVLSGFLLNNGLYGTPAIYQTLHVIHAVSKVLVPLAVIVHVVARVYDKKMRTAKRA